MSDGFDDFARDCRAMAAAVKKLPSDVRAELGREVKTRVAEPLAQKIAEQAHGPYGRALAASVKVRVSADPTIVVGGTRPVVSGGATGRDLVFGTEFGGGNRVSVVNRERHADGRKRVGRIGRGEQERQRARGRSVYKRHTTKQFRNPNPFVYPTVEANVEWALDEFAAIVMGKIANILPGS